MQTSSLMSGRRTLWKQWGVLLFLTFAWSRACCCHRQHHIDGCWRECTRADLGPFVMPKVVGVLPDNTAFDDSLALIFRNSAGLDMSSLFKTSSLETQ